MIKDWLENHWVAGALFMGVALLLLAPVVIAGNDRSVLLVYLASAVYMIHQVEEHTGDRFRAYVNSKVFGGVEALTIGDVLWINLPGVWGVNLVALYAAFFVDPGYGLMAPYLILVNGIAHVGMAARLRAYNPGLVTGVVLFFPFALASIVLIPATPAQHALGLAISLAIHAAIAIHAGLRAQDAVASPA